MQEQEVTVTQEIAETLINKLNEDMVNKKADTLRIEGAIQGIQLYFQELQKVEQSAELEDVSDK